MGRASRRRIWPTAARSPEAEAAATGGRTDKEQRIIAGFEEIERFVEEHGRQPEHGESRDIFERLYAVRLDRIREFAECRGVLAGLDSKGLLGPDNEPRESRIEEAPTDYELLAALGVAADPVDDVTKLVHVRPREEIKAAEEIAQRNPCKDFAAFQPLFEKIQRELASGMRHTLPYKDNAETKKGDLFILDGQKVIVADMGDPFVSDYGRPDRRLRVVYDKGTESDLLTLKPCLHPDSRNRRRHRHASHRLPAFSENGDNHRPARCQLYRWRNITRMDQPDLPNRIELPATGHRRRTEILDEGMLVAPEPR